LRIKYWCEFSLHAIQAILFKEANMAGGWAKDGAVQEQIDASVDDAVARAKSQIPKGKSAHYCEECNAPIPEARRTAVPGVRLCINCQAAEEKHSVAQSTINRRGSKDSQLR
jgi:phage/conjugal plasmid C-4 type zinc finger TraR family protein